MTTPLGWATDPRRVASPDRGFRVAERVQFAWVEIPPANGRPTGRAIAETRDGLDHIQSSTDPGYHYYVPPIEWTAYLEQRGLSKAQICGCCMRTALMKTGPEESLRLWHESGRPSA